MPTAPEPLSAPPPPPPPPPPPTTFGIGSRALSESELVIGSGSGSGSGGSRGLPRVGSEAELDRLRSEILTLKGAEMRLQRRLAAKKHRNPGGKRCCCCLVVLAAAVAACSMPPTALLLSLRASFHQELPEKAQAYADWFLQHPIMPRTAVEIAETVLGPSTKTPGQVSDWASKGVSQSVS